MIFGSLTPYTCSHACITTRGGTGDDWYCFYCGVSVPRPMPYQHYITQAQPVERNQKGQ